MVSAMYLRLSWPVWLLAIVWLGIGLVAALMLVNPARAAGSPLAAPTLLQQDPTLSGDRYYVAGLTRQGTSVVVTMNGQTLSGVRYGKAKRGITSFAVPLPADLYPGRYAVTAKAQRRGSQSGPSQALELVVAGTAQSPERIATAQNAAL